MKLSISLDKGHYSLSFDIYYVNYTSGIAIEKMLTAQTAPSVQNQNFDNLKVLGIWP